MRKYFDTVINRGNGEPVAGATVSVTTAAGAEAQLYAGDGTSPLTSPINAVQTNANGLFQFYVADGSYTITVTNAGKMVSVGDVEIYDLSNVVSAPAAFRGSSVYLYGDGTGVTDSTAAFQAAFAALPFGGVVNIPRGLFNVTGLSVPDGVELRGQGRYASVIRLSQAGGNIALGALSGLRWLKVACLVTRTPTSPCVDILANSGYVTECVIDNYGNGIRVGMTGLVVAAHINDVQFSNGQLGAGSGSIYLVNFSNAVIDKVLATGTASGQQQDYGIRVENGDTWFVSNSNFTRVGNALFISTPAGLNCYGGRISNSFFDSATTISGGAMAFAGSIVPAGGVEDLRITGSWFGLSGQGLVCQPTGAGFMRDFDISAQFVDNADCGAVLSTAVSGGRISGTAGGNTNFGVKIFGSASGIDATGIVSGAYADRGPQNVGIGIQGTANNVLINPDMLLGNTTAPYQNTSAGANVKKLSTAAA